jgi:curved DNA-binding protein CbpA
MPCQGCFATGRDLKLRYYRRVTAMLFVDQIHAVGGYLCRSCRWKQFGRHFAHTLFFGWWGVFALLFRNPFAIVTNIWALFAPPLGAGELRALNVNELRAGAAESDHQAPREQKLADAYMNMPSWFETLDDNDINVVLTDRDLYADLGLQHTATAADIKTAYRIQVKRHHPDAASADGHERMVHINGAYQVLSDERLRHAYDRADELVAWLTTVRDGDVDDWAENDPMAGYDWGCRACQAAFTEYDEVYEHVVSEHPDEDPVAIVAELEDGVETGLKTIYVCRLCGSRELMLHEFVAHLSHEHPDVGLDAAVDFEYIDMTVDDGDEESRPQHDRWRCKTCEQIFDSYDAAVSHADSAHPERVAVDIRNAVEAI